MVREFSEEKRQEIFRLLDEIDNREWKSFMEWCGSSAEEFGDWPDKLAVSAYTRYVDKYHERVLEINEMTRNRVNTVFENVAEIDTRYAGRMRECQEKIKEQIAMVNTMTEFMQSMTDGKPNMALLTNGSVNESIRTEEEVDLTMTSSNDAENEINFCDLKDYFNSEKEFSEDEILQILDGALYSGDITQDEYDYMKELFTKMYDLKDEILIQSLYEELEIEYNRITRRIQNGENETNIYFLNDYFDSGEEFSKDEILWILDGSLLSGDITREEYKNLILSFTKMFDSTDERRIQTLYEEIKNEYERIAERNQYIQIYINEDFLRNIGFDFDKLGIDNLVVELKKGMIQYNITGEESIQMFLANCRAETGGTDLLEKYNNNGDAGSGLIQVTGEAQYRFLKMVLARYEEGSPKWNEINAICRQFEDADEKYVGYHSTNNSGITPKKYIADNYPVESAVWFWGGYSAKCIIYNDANNTEQGCVYRTINQYVEIFKRRCKGREEDLFLATQYYVNSAKLRAPYLQQLCEGYCDQNQKRYCITYFSNGNIVDLADIEAAAQNNDNTIISQLPIDKVEYQDRNPDAPIGCVDRFWYYYRILALREEMEMQ